MCKHWGLHISTDINCLGKFLDLFWEVWRGLLWCLKPKHKSWWCLRYLQFNKRYHGGYQLICLISRPFLITLRCNWYRLKGLFKGFWEPLRLWELLKNWWRHDQMKFVTSSMLNQNILTFITTSFESTLLLTKFQYNTAQLMIILLIYLLRHSQK